MAQSSQLTVLKAPPRYTGQADNDYHNELNRWFQSLYDYTSGVTYLRGNGLFLPNLPTSGYLLKAGEVFSNGGVLTIVRDGDIWAGGMSIGCAVGSVTVTV
jgi:hypothetical protein